MIKKKLFEDSLKRKRYFCALLMVGLMAGIAETLGEKEIIFPEMAALTVGMWIVDKRVWQVNRWQLVILMTVGAIAGVTIVRYFALPLVVNLAIAFSWAALCLILSRTTLIPLLSACMLPVLLQTESWIYPLAVGMMSLILVAGNWGMEKKGWKNGTVYKPVGRTHHDIIFRWPFLLITVVSVAFLSLATAAPYLILPPLVVTYVEFANSKAGFRNRPLQVVAILFVASCIGVGFQMLGSFLHLPLFVVAVLIIASLFTLFEYMGKYFAPAGAVALIPLILPEENLIGLPLQVLMGAALFIGIAMICFQKCLRWPKSRLWVCFLPSYIRGLRK